MYLIRQKPSKIFRHYFSGEKKNCAQLKIETRQYVTSCGMQGRNGDVYAVYVLYFLKKLCMKLCSVCTFQRNSVTRSSQIKL